MIYRSYGQTGIKVSVIGMGGMRFENDNNPKDMEAAVELVKAAYEAGINYFDTAPPPGYGKSEEIIGTAFKEMKKTRAEKPFYAATKTNKSDPQLIRKELEGSLKRLNLEYIDFYHVWCVMSPEDYEGRKSKGALTEFERLKSEGLVKHICISTHMAGPDIAEALSDYPFDGVLLGYSAANFAYRQQGIEAAAKLNQGVVVMNPLGGGIIPQHPERFGFVKIGGEQSVVEGALRFLINEPRITVALAGLSNQEHLREAVSAINGFEPITVEGIRKIRDSLDKAFDQLCTCCRYCDNCPQGIAVPKLMDSYNQYALSGKTIDMINRLRWHWGISLDGDIAAECTQCGQCEEACTQKLPILARLNFIQSEIQKFFKT